jgi:MYXO-CTERM domain-containing protein
MAKCSASCEGSCTAEANVDCQVTCQSGGYLTCSADLMGGCTTACETPNGALFCDGQYVDVAGSLEACLLFLEDELEIDVDGYVSGECIGNTCTAEAGASCSCRAGAPGGSSGAPIAATFLAIVVGLTIRRRSK